MGVRSASRRLIVAFQFGWVMVSATAAHAEDGVPSMTLDEALTYAAQHHPRLLVAAEEVKARIAAAKVPGKRWLPRVGVAAQAVLGTNNNSASNWLSSRGAVEQPRIAGTPFLQHPRDINWKPYLTTVASVGFEQEIFDFGRIAAEQALEDARTHVVQQQTRVEQLDVALAVRESYLSVQAAHEVLAAAEQVVERTRAHRDAICALGREGLKPAADCQRGEADLARYQAALARAEGSLEAAMVTFAAAMGNEADEVDARGDAPTLSDLPSLSEAVRAATQREPRMEVAKAQAKTSSAEQKRAAAELRPQLYAIGTLQGAAGGAPVQKGESGTYGAGTLPWIPNYFAGAVLAWNILDAPAVAKLKAAKAEAKAAEQRTREVHEEVRVNAARAWVDASAAMRALPELQHALEAAEINYAKVDGRYREGLSTIIDLVDAEALRVDAQIGVAVGRFEAARSRARLDRALVQENKP